MEQIVTDYIKNELGIKVHHVKFIARSESKYCVGAGTSYRTVPYLDIFVYESSYESVIGEHRNTGLAKAEIADKIIDFIGNYNGQTGQTFDKAECYDPQMYVGVHSWDKYCYADFAYNHKPEIEECICGILAAKPRGIYASSLPGVNVVYETECYNQNHVDEYAESIKAGILRLAGEFVLDKYKESLDSSLFYVSIWHPDMKGYNGYAIARQD